jgi:hypothetical protein
MRYVEIEQIGSPILAAFWSGWMSRDSPTS